MSQQLVGDLRYTKNYRNFSSLQIGFSSDEVTGDNFIFC